MINIEKSFTFAFKAPDASKKLFFGGLYSLLYWTVFFGFVVMGYLMEVLCNALEGRDVTLPKWKDRRRLFNEGTIPVLIVLAYGAPIVLSALVEQVIYSVVDPNYWIVGLFTIIRFVLLLGLSALLPLALIRFAITSSFRAAFNLGEIIGFMKNNPGNFFTAWVLSSTVQAIAGLGVVLLVVGLAFTSFIAHIITFHLYAQAYRASKPFSDDAEGELRASMAVPPPLNIR